MASDVPLEQLAVDQAAVWRALRSEGAVVELPAVSGWVVIGRALAERVLRDPARFTVDDPRFSTGQVVGPSMLSLDGSEHSRHRESFLTLFGRPLTDASFRSWLAGEAERLVRRLVERGGGDAGAEVARPLAVAAMCRTLGFDLELVDSIDAWYRAIAAAVENAGGGRASSTDAVDAMTGLAEVVGDAIRDGGPLAAAATFLSLAELTSNVAVALFGGVETAEGMIGNAVWSLLADPCVGEGASADPALIPAIVDESSRLFPAAASVHRYATESVELDGVAIPSGAFVDVSLMAANRDPAAFEDPNRFDPMRANLREQLTFARGPHMCLGIGLARQEAQVVVRTMCDLGGGVALAADAVGPRGHTFIRPQRFTVEVT